MVAVTPRGGAATPQVATADVDRGGRPLARGAALAVTPDGGLRGARGPVVEDLRDDARGRSQSWAFAHVLVAWQDRPRLDGTTPTSM